MSEPELHNTTGPNVPVTTRRNVLKGIGAVGAAGAAGVAADGPVGDADAIACGGVCIGLAVAGGAAVGYLVGEAADHYLGPDRSDELDGTEETADLHRELRTRLIETHAANGDVLTTMNNRVQDARNVAWPAAKKAAVKARNNEESESAAKTAATAEVDSHYATIQKNLLNRWTEVVNSWENIFDLHESDSTLSGSPVIRMTFTWQNGGTGDTNPGQWTRESRSTSLVNGNSYSFPALKSKEYSNSDTTENFYLIMSPVGYHREGNDGYGPYDWTFEVDPVDSGEVKSWSNGPAWGNIWTAIQDDHSQMVSNVNTFVTNLYQTTSPGELDPSNWLDASTLASELSSDYDSTGYHAYAAAEAAVAGIPGQMENAMRVTWEESGVTVSGSIWTGWAPAASSSTSTETSTETSTGSGTTAAGTEAFQVGQMYDPANTNKLVLLSYEYGGDAWIDGSDVWVGDGSGGWEKDTSVTSKSGWDALEGKKLQVGYGELTQPFTIESATNTNTGESIDVVTTESKNHQTSGVDVTEEEMQALLDLAEEMRSNSSPGGGGGFDPSSFSFMGIPGVAVLGGGATVAASVVAYFGTR